MKLHPVLEKHLGSSVSPSKSFLLEDLHGKQLKLEGPDVFFVDTISSVIATLNSVYMMTTNGSMLRASIISVGSFFEVILVIKKSLSDSNPPTERYPFDEVTYKDQDYKIHIDGKSIFCSV